MGPGGLDSAAAAFRGSRHDREFRAHYDQAALAHSRRAAILAVALYASFAYLDTLEVSGDVSGLFIVRFAIVCPFITVLAFAHLSPVGRAWYLQLVICCARSVAALGLERHAAGRRRPDRLHAHGTLLILMFCSRSRGCASCGRPRRRSSSWPATRPALRGGTAMADVLYNNFFLLSFIVIGAATSYVLERLRREEFISGKGAGAGARRGRTPCCTTSCRARLASRLRTNRATIAEGADDVSVLFAESSGSRPCRRPFRGSGGRPARHAVHPASTSSVASAASRRSRRSATPTWRAGVPRPDPDHAASIARAGARHAGRRRVPRRNTGQAARAPRSASAPGPSWLA
jgi:hypothetical protein